MKSDGFPRRSKAAFEINAKFLSSALCGWLAYAVWPTSWDWWGFALCSTLLGVACLAMAIKACKLIVTVWKRDRAIAAFEGSGIEPKSAGIADIDRLRKAGMVR